MSIEKLTRYKELNEKDKISLSDEGKELKDKIGIELFQLFNSIWKDKTKIFAFKMIQNSSEMLENKELSRNDFVKKMNNLAEKLLKEMAEELRNNPKIITAFLGKEELLNKAIDYGISTTIADAKKF